MTIRPSSRLALACAALALASIALRAPGQQQILDAPPVSTPVASLSSLRQIVKVYDFEDGDGIANALPIPFYRYAPVREGFPPFGNTRLSNARACTGNGSLEFELGGGSMAVRIPASVINVLPLADYVVSVKVRTEDLHHARARLVAWFHDTHGRVIEGSRASSRLAETAGKWETLSVDIGGSFAEAADLVFELQVVQPAQFDAAATTPTPNAPRLEDISGHVWFDDVTISHLPRVSLTMAQPGNIIRLPQAPQLQIQVSELTSETLSARIWIVNLDGRVVYDTTFPAPRGRQVATMRVPLANCGWYRAVLDINSGATLSRRESLDFVLLPQPGRRTGLDHRQFGIALSPDQPADPALIPAAISAIESGSAIVPMWTSQESGASGLAERRRMIERLLQQNQELIFSLDVIPAELAAATGIERSSVLQILQQDSKVWRGHLDDLLLNFGLEISRWQIGSTGTDGFRTAGLPALVSRASKSFAEFMPEPVIFTPCSIEHAVAPGDQLPAYALTIPHEVAPAAIPEYAAEWARQGGQSYAAFELLPPEHGTPHQRVADLMARALYGWRAGLPMMVIKAPWQIDVAGPSGLMPEPAFAAWRSIAEHLGGRTFVGELPIGAGRHCWILKGAGPSDSAMVAWSDRVAGDAPEWLSAQLGNGPVEVTDAFGNSSTVSPENGEHRIALHDLPVFIQRMNLELVQFRSGVGIESAFIPAIAKQHERELVLHNPWDVAVNGSVRVIVDDQWQITPDVQDFVIHAHGETRLPLAIIPQRSILAGNKRVQLQIDLNADQHYTLAMATELEVGLENISLAASWSLAANAQTGVEDLVVTQVVTNRGNQPMNLEVYLLAADLGQNRKTIPLLNPGETQVRSFRIPNGVRLMAGKDMRVGVSDRDGLMRLNYMLAIPTREAMFLQAGAAKADGSTP